MAQTELNAEAEAQLQKTQHRQLLFLLALGLVAAIATVIFVKARKIRAIARKRDEEITRLNKQIDIALAKLQQERQDPQLPLQPVTTTPAYDSLEQGFKCYRDIIMELTTVHGSKHVKHNNLAKVLTPEFFGRLRQYVNARHDNLITKLANGPYKLSEQDINIICLELCHFPNAVLWAYLDTNDIHAVYNRKTYIIKKIGIVKKIDELPTYFANTPATSV